MLAELLARSVLCLSVCCETKSLEKWCSSFQKSLYLPAQVSFLREEMVRRHVLVPLLPLPLPPPLIEGLDAEAVSDPPLTFKCFDACIG